MTGSKIFLQDRDRRLLREIAEMRVADRVQVQCAAGFGSVTRVNARLLALTRAGFLRRFFLGTVGGARKSLYSVSVKGAELVDVPARGPRRGQDQTLLADLFASHQLEINSLYCLLKHTLIPLEGVSFRRWLSFQAALDPAHSLIPDGYVELSTPERTMAMFIEVDLGNESRKVWQRKVREYLRFATSGTFHAKFGHRQFRVLTVANSERRMASLCNATAALTDRIFWFTTLDSIREQGFWSAVWRRAQSPQKLCLL
jgi:hypothetical protein